MSNALLILCFVLPRWCDGTSGKAAAEGTIVAIKVVISHIWRRYCAGEPVKTSSDSEDRYFRWVYKKVPAAYENFDINANFKFLEVIFWQFWDVFKKFLSRLTVSFFEAFSVFGLNYVWGPQLTKRQQGLHVLPISDVLCVLNWYNSPFKDKKVRTPSEFGVLDPFAPQ